MVYLRKILFVVMGICMFGVNGQTNDFEKRLEESYNLYINGEEITDWLRGIQSFEKLGNEFSNESLPNYWASYFYTQVARALRNVENPPEGVDRSFLLDKAQENLDAVKSRINNVSQVELSDVHALQYLIYSFRTGASENEDIKKQFSDKAKEELKKSIFLNPNNPLCDVIVATNLINKQDFESVFAGRSLLIAAKDKFNRSMKPKFLTTHWNEEWTKFWLASANKGVEFLTKPAEE